MVSAMYSRLQTPKQITADRDQTEIEHEGHEGREEREGPLVFLRVLCVLRVKKLNVGGCAISRLRTRKGPPMTVRALPHAPGPDYT